MRKVIFYAATSLDGFLARDNDAVDWLFHPDPEVTDYGYRAFYDSVDTLLMGRKSYQQILTFGDWPYPDRHSIVFSNTITQAPDRLPVKFAAGDPRAVIQELQGKGDKNIWLVGGGVLLGAFLAEKLVDEIILSIHPILLGHGIPVVANLNRDVMLRLQESRSYPDGLVQCHYRVER